MSARAIWSHLHLSALLRAWCFSTSGAARLSRLSPICLWGATVKGKPWSVAEEKRLQQLLSEKNSVRTVAEVMGKSVDCVRKKINRLGIVVVHDEDQSRTTSKWVLPEELPSVEEALKILAAAMDALRQPGLDKTEILRLRSVIQAANVYQARVAEYVNYVKIEAKVFEMEAKLSKFAIESKEDAAVDEETSEIGVRDCSDESTK